MHTKTNRQRRTLMPLILLTLSGFLSQQALSQSTLLDQKAPFVQESLPYAYDALEPSIDARTMEIHYTKHHAGYVKNLNTALEGTPFAGWTLEEILEKVSQTNDAIRNNAGGHFNHTLFWEVLSANHPFDPESAVGEAVIRTFGSVGNLKNSLMKAGASRFGSGWAWLVVTPDKQLVVCSTPNQDNPLMDITEVKGIPILGIDVWEHAYYLNYQNRRGDYLTAVWDVINWDAVNHRNQAALKKINEGWK